MVGADPSEPGEHDYTGGDRGCPPESRLGCAEGHRRAVATCRLFHLDQQPGRSFVEPRLFARWSRPMASLTGVRPEPVPGSYSRAQDLDLPRHGARGHSRGPALGHSLFQNPEGASTEHRARGRARDRPLARGRAGAWNVECRARAIWSRLRARGARGAAANTAATDGIVLHSEELQYALSTRACA